MLELDPEVFGVLDSWDKISQQFYSLFDRALRDYGTTVDRLFARLAISEIKREDFSDDVKKAVKSAADDILADQAKFRSEYIDNALQKPRAHLASIDAFVDDVLKRSSGGCKTHRDNDDARSAIEQFLHECQEFTRSVSAIHTTIKMDRS